MVVKSAERTCNVCSLFCLNLVHKEANILRHRIHTKGVKTTLQHMCLNTCLVERSCPLSYSLVRILSKEQIHLLKCATVCLHTVKAAHIYDDWRYLLQLVHSRNIFARRLPHIPIEERKFNLFCHLKSLNN